MRKNKIISILIIFVILSSYLPAMLNIVNAVEETQKINAEEITANSFENEKLGQYILENYDTDKDGILSDLEIEEITDLELDFSEKNKEEVATRQEQNEEIPLEEDKEGISLQGIQNLTNLQNINLIGNFTNYAILDELEKLKEVHIKNTSLETENIKILKGKTQEIELPEILKSAFNPESKLYIGEDAKFNLISSDETREPCISLNEDKTAIIIDTTNANIGENEDLIIFDEKDEDCKLAGTTISVKFEVYEEETNKDDNAENKEENATENEVVDNTVKEEQIPEANQNLLMQAKTQEPQVTYQAHVGNVGWMNSVQSEQTAGLAGSGNDLEALKISLVNASGNAHIKYQAHVSNVGWQSYVQDGSQAGTTGESKPIEAVRIKLEGITGYSVEYRTYVKNQGWQQWVSDGVTAGTTGQSTTIEAIQIRIVKTEELQPSKPEIAYSGHVSGIGWMSHAHNGETAGVVGSENLEAIRIELVNTSETAHIKYQAHVSNVGWQSYVQDGSQAGTTGESKPIEAVRIKLEGITGYSVEYRTYVKNQGWQQWVSDGVTAGTTGQSTTIEAIQIRIVKTEELQPSKPEIAYSGHVSGIGWMSHAHNGETAGVVGSENLEAIRIELVNTSETAHIKYQVHVSNVGWMSTVQDGSDGGVTGQSKAIEAIRINLEGIPGYSVEYRAYVRGQGWQAWAADGMTAGTEGQSTTIQAIQIRIVKTEDTVVPKVQYSGYVNNTWTSSVSNEETLGVIGSNLEGIKINLVNADENAHIKYTPHVKDIGWRDTVQDGEVAGITGQNLGLEALRIELEGLDGYSIEYRAYVQGQGWQDWVSDGLTAGTTGASLPIQAIQIRIAIKFKKKNTSNFTNMDESKYPGFKQKLQQLQAQHPNWILTIKYTGLDWNAVLNGEDVLVNGQPKSLTQNTNQWINGNTEYGTGWRRASREAIAYMMDPRNSLDETYIFQFQDLTSIAGTYDDISKMIEGSFLTKYSTSSTDSIINAILSSSRTYNVSPYHLVSRMLQEQGNDGSVLNGYTYNGRIVYNLFNIGATGSTDAEIIQNGAKYAYDKHWFTPETCILGSASFLNSGYLSKGQTTLYFQKYNVVNAPYFENQYMQNIRAANDEGARISNEYKENGLINGEFEFVIPVYENMPATAVPRPIG